MRTRTKPLAPITSAIIALGALLLPTGIDAQTYTVHSGYDLFTTDANSTTFDGIPFKGDPLGHYQFPNPTNGYAFPSPSDVGLTDTIMQRLDNVTDVGGSGTTDIQLVALQLESQSQVPLPGHPGTHNVFVTLSNTIPSTGSMTIDFNANGTGGTWSANFNVYVDLHLDSLTGANIDSQLGYGNGPIELMMTTGGTPLWDHTPAPMTSPLVIDGINQKLDGTDTSEDFWQQGIVMHDGTGGANHGVQPDPMCPEPGPAMEVIGIVVFSGLCAIRKRSR